MSEIIMTQKHEIKNRWTNEVLFTCDIPEGMESGMIARHAVEAAIAHGADLRGADLQDANLRGADLRGANLQDADLQDANLQDANLWRANLWRAKNAPVIINGLRWMVYINGTGMMRIGCQNHSIERWKGFSDELISRMDSDALEFWNKYKVMLLAVCDTHVHKEESS